MGLGVTGLPCPLGSSGLLWTIVPWEGTLRHTQGSHTALLEGSLWPRLSVLGRRAAHAARLVGRNLQCLLSWETLSLLLFLKRSPGSHDDLGGSLTCQSDGSGVECGRPALPRGLRQVTPGGGCEAEGAVPSVPARAVPAAGAWCHYTFIKHLLCLSKCPGIER